MPNIETLDLVTSVNLRHIKSPENPHENGDPKDCYHFLYGSTLYGTLFGVFGQFETRPISGSDDLHVVSLTMEILNYQGALNIGFSTANPKYIETTKEKVVHFGVRAGSGRKQAPVAIDPWIKVKKDERTRLLFNRVVYPMTNFTVGTNPSQQLGVPNQADMYFDSEFHYRSGGDHFHQFARGGMSQTQDGPGDVHALIPSIRCIQGVASLYH
jgi:hypothetical protein